MSLQQVQMYRSALQSSADYSGRERMMLALGLAYVGFPTLGLIDTCAEHAQSDFRWRDTCQQFGKRLARDSKILLSERIGLGILQGVAEAGSDEPTPDLLERLDQIKRYQRRVSDIDFVISHDERLFSEYIDRMIVEGQRPAMDFVESEMSRLGILPPCSQ